MESKPRADLDIFPKLAAYLDPHLVIPVLESDFYRGLQVSKKFQEMNNYRFKYNEIRVIYA